VRLIPPNTVAVPAPSALTQLLAQHAPLRPAPLCPELFIHQADSLVAIWEAAESIAGSPLPSPFWAYAWPGGCALARVLLDNSALVCGASVLDFGAGGGVSCIAALRAGAIRATANDVDAWALAVARLTAAANGVSLDTLADDVCASMHLVDTYDVILCSDLAYERSETPRQRRVLERALHNGATVLVADAGRTYFDATGMTQLAEFEVDVPQDLEGVGRRTARVYRM
jgi:predicted nicotinamide N-methyase